MILSLLLSLAMSQSTIHSGTAIPSPRQLEWQKLEYYAFVHFGPNTFADQEWGHGNEDPNSFNPTALDCRQWVRTFKEAGMKQVIITAKHHDGFCLWPSNFSKHTVAQSKWRDGKGDVLAELRKACDEYGMKMGVYLSPWDRNHPQYGTPGYNIIFAAMLKEVLTKYGPVYEVWFDGANGEGPNGKRQIYDWNLFISTVRQYAPDAVIFSDAGPDIRWVGNEDGIAGETCWSTVDLSSPKTAIGAADTKYLNVGDPKGKDWVPAECDVSIRPGWFYHASQDNQVKSPAKLFELYEKSVGRNGSLLLNVPPDRRGLIHENDVKALMGFKKLRDASHREARDEKDRGARDEKDPIFLNSTGRPPEADGPFGKDSSPELLKVEKYVDGVLLREHIVNGQHVTSFEIRSYIDGKATTVATGTTIGNKRIVRFQPVKTKCIWVIYKPSFPNQNLGIGPSISEPEFSRANEVEITSLSSPVAISAEIKSMVAASQKAHGDFRFGTMPIEEKKRRADVMAKVDKANTARMKEIVNQNGWPTQEIFGTEGASNAWLLLQYADAEPDFQENCLKLMEPLAQTGDVKRVDWAMLTDRVLCARGKKQRYGTQNSLEGSKWIMKPVEEPKNLDARRAEVGLIPVEDYNTFMMKLMKGQVGEPETKAQKDKRMAWFREARFGMFIHWGLYAVPAGEWKGKNFAGASEWLMYSAQISAKDYHPLQAQFNPVKYDAKRWVQIAKDAGMKYIVITSKHHDGFALFDSKLTDWDIMNTPFKRDALKELAKACKEGGIKLCFYHSIMDWTHPDYGLRRPWDLRPEVPTNMDKYTVFMKGQLKELLTNYGDIGILWFDGEWEPQAWTHERGVDLYHYVRSLQPKIIINNRVDVHRSGMAGMSANDQAVGDYGTPEQEIPANGMPGLDWESCMTMNGSWGFHKNDQSWKSAETLVHNVIDCASKGGNYLLNVGPTNLGEIPEASVQRLAAVGAWMKLHGETIYGSQAGPFAKPLPWGRATRKGNKLYLHLFNPSLATIELTGLDGKIGKAYRFLDKKRVAIVKSKNGWTVTNPEPKVFIKEPMPEVFVVEFTGKLVAITPPAPPIVPDPNGNMILKAIDAEVQGSAHYESDESKQCIGFWTNSNDVVSWQFVLDKPGNFQLSAEVACEPSSAGNVVGVLIGVKPFSFTVPDTGSWTTFTKVEIGKLALAPGGKVKVVVKAQKMAGGALMNLRSVSLVRQND